MSKLTVEDEAALKRIVHTLSHPTNWLDDWRRIDAILSTLSSEEATRAALATIVAFTSVQPGAEVIPVMLLHMWDIAQWLDPIWETNFRWRLNFLSSQRLAMLSKRRAAVLQFAPQIMHWSAAIFVNDTERVLADASRFADEPGGLGHQALRVLGLNALKHEDLDAAIDFFLRGIAKESDDVLLYFGYFHDLEQQILHWFTLSEDEQQQSRSLRQAVSRATEF